MRAEALLPRLDGVRRTSRGWKARCPSHRDRHPSLSISEGDRGLLLRCWAGCTVAQICTALGIPVAQLFYKAVTDDPASRRRIERDRRYREARREWIDHFQGLRLDLLRAAEQLIIAAQGLDISLWSDDALEERLESLADAHFLLREDMGEEDYAQWTASH